jgi:hypothetical protein
VAWQQVLMDLMQPIAMQWGGRDDGVDQKFIFATCDGLYHITTGLITQSINQSINQHITN